MSDTPKTDEMFSTETALSDGELVVPISFARQLERENAAMAEENSRLRVELDAHHNGEQLRRLRAEVADLTKRLEAHDGWDDYNAIKGLQADNAKLRKDKERLDWMDRRTVSRLDWVLTNVEMHKLPIRDAIDVSMKEVEP